MTDFLDGNTGTRLEFYGSCLGPRIAVIGVVRDRDTGEWQEVHRATHSFDAWEEIAAEVVDMTPRPGFDGVFAAADAEYDRLKDAGVINADE